MKCLLENSEIVAWGVKDLKSRMTKKGASVIATFEINRPYGTRNALENGLYVIWIDPKGDRAFSRFGTLQEVEREQCVCELRLSLAQHDKMSLVTERVVA